VNVLVTVYGTPPIVTVVLVTSVWGAVVTIAVAVDVPLMSDAKETEPEGREDDARVLLSRRGKPFTPGSDIWVDATAVKDAALLLDVSIDVSSNWLCVGFSFGVTLTLLIEYEPNVVVPSAPEAMKLTTSLLVVAND